MPFGRYRLVDLIGRGGMGEVWKAFDTATQRVVAVKVLPAQLASDPAFKQRFRHEAYAAAGLSNPHVVPIHDFGEIDGRLYVDMRLIEGKDLEHLLADGPLDPPRAIAIIEQIASALGAAHRIGLVHRDVKPSNILVAEDDFAYLIDFGIARAAGDTKLTATGSVVGTWPYMAPERFTTGQVDSRADVYALACVLYECLTSSRPFPGDSVEQQIAGHLTTPPPRPSINRPGVATALDSVIASGMAKDPDERYATATELARAASSAIAASESTRPAPAISYTVAGDAPAAPTQADTATQLGEALSPTQARPAEQVEPPWAPTQSATPEHAEAWAATQTRPAEQVDAPWAPTQSGTPRHVEKAWAATQASPAERVEQPESAAQPTPDIVTPERWPDEVAPSPRWRRAAIVVPVAVILIAAGIATILTVLSSGGDPTKGAPAAPLNGTFAAAFGAPTQPDGQPFPNAPGGEETWAITSACRSDGCVATATKVSGSIVAATTLVLDEVNGNWTGVDAEQGTCGSAGPAEVWSIMSLQTQPDGSLAGEFVVRSTNSDCASNRPVTLTRTGAVTSDVRMVDPASQPPRVTSPGEGLRGRYQETDTYTDGNRSAEVSFDIQTYCLRTGDRCLSYWLGPGDVKILTFAQNRWTLANRSSDSTCESGGPAQREITLQYPLPQPAQNPITLLTGRGHYTVTGACPFNSDFDSRVQRTGD